MPRRSGVEVEARVERGPGFDAVAQTLLDHDLHLVGARSRAAQLVLAGLQPALGQINLGRGKGRRYCLPPGDIVVRVPTAKLAITGHPPQVEIYPPVSPEAKALRAAVREARRPLEES